jgi:hypothetical protein
MLKACYIYGLQDHTKIATNRIVVWSAFNWKY